MHSVIVILMASLIALAPSMALAQNVREGSLDTTNDWLILLGAGDGTVNRELRTDPAGILRTTEEYPVQYQTFSLNVANTVVCTTTVQQIGNSWEAHPWGRQVIKIEHADGNGECLVYLYGSDDDVNFDAVSPTWDENFDGISAPDTLKYYLRDNDVLRIPLEPGMYLGRYGAIYGIKNGTSTNQLTITVEGRMD